MATAIRSTTNMQHDREYTRDLQRFIREYNDEAVKIERLESINNGAAADGHVRLGAKVARFLDLYEDRLQASDHMFLRRETVARTMQALLLRSMQLSGFGDLTNYTYEQQNLERDLATARRRLENARNNVDVGDSGGDDVDPRTDTRGLYEYIPYESLSISLDDLPGYEEQHRLIVNAYFDFDSSASNAKRNARDTNNSIDGRKPRTKAGANVILYGPPGTGKTVAARAVAQTLRLNLAFVNAENLLSSYRSETEKNLRILYERMCALVHVTGRNVLLMDEVDGLVKNRSGSSGASPINSGDYSLLTRFLTILESNDGMDKYGVFIMFITNRLDNMDDAFRQ
ncbi:uncharacterized protein LOC112588772 [Harpegnathos saltator]|uniref:uncharacterized protein LOC112588772 n=1 Tax=Harpegnathos saltator TaxID=610380 RepID=UPI000DBEED4F|nr:uncharacterized protein LOC112588772 [Harpegnathos saltator]